MNLENRDEMPLDLPSAVDMPSRIGTRAQAMRNARLLIVDDEPANVALLEDMLSDAGYEQVKSTTDSSQALRLCREFVPDLILLDLMMPGLDGMAVMEQVKGTQQEWANVPILMLTADITPQSKRSALAKGASDFLNKPFDAVELLLRIGNLLETRSLHQNLRRQNEQLEDRVRARTAELELAQELIVQYAQEVEEAHCETLERLAVAGEFRDDDTGQHTQRVARVTAMLAEGVGQAANQIPWIQQAARLHDAGKIGISDSILLKPGKLTEEEFAIMKTHTTIGAKLFDGAKSELIQIAQRIAASHHERWDGNGYPQGLCGEDIPIEARLVSVADVFDALTHERPYKKAWPVGEAVAEIAAQSGRQFDPAVVDVFLRLPHGELV